MNLQNRNRLTDLESLWLPGGMVCHHTKISHSYWLLGFPGGSDGKESACDVGDLSSIPGLGRSSRGGHGNPLQYSCLENPMDRGAGGLQPMGSQRVDTTEQLHVHFSLSYTVDGNGNPLQCSCLENPRDGEPGGLPPMGSHRVRDGWSDLAAAAAALAQIVKNLPAMQKTQVQSLGWEDSLERKMATHFRILAWRIPWTQESEGLQSNGVAKSRTWLSD